MAARNESHTRCCGVKNPHPEKKAVNFTPMQPARLGSGASLIAGHPLIGSGGLQRANHGIDGDDRRIVGHRIDFTAPPKPAGHPADAVQPLQGRFSDAVSGNVKGGRGRITVRRPGNTRRASRQHEQRQKDMDRTFHEAPPGEECAWVFSKRLVNRP